MKTLIIRFFSDKKNQIPTDSYPIDRKDCDIGFVIYKWMEMYPEGKVDFINVNH